MNIPAKLIIKDGELFLLSEPDRTATEYLKGWQADATIKNGEIVNVIIREQYKKLREELVDQRELIQAC